MRAFLMLKKKKQNENGGNWFCEGLNKAGDGLDSFEYLLSIQVLARFHGDK